MKVVSGVKWVFLNKCFNFYCPCILMKDDRHFDIKWAHDVQNLL